uniref:Hemicentin-1-like isoform X2 n=1 Tax=Crassostrea virginica TaxID=6565 RepID=A0A8B8CWR5_CRAVI|nr:hemicentin-1-like isoform X2 [Crassostrea virginica]
MEKWSLILVICVFTVICFGQIVKGYKVWISPNKNVFYAEPGITLNITCESDCGTGCRKFWEYEDDVKWTFFKHHPKQLNEPLNRRESYRCTVADRNRKRFHSTTFKIFKREPKGIAEELPGENNLTSSDIISTVKSASSEQEQNYDPRNVTIEKISAEIDIWEGGDDIRIRCNADCNPPCDKYMTYHNNEQISTFKETRITTDRKNSGQYTCSASNSFRQKYVSSNNTVNFTIKYDPHNVTIEKIYTNEDILEGGDDIIIRCKADCNPPCDRYQIYHNNKRISSSKETRITMDRKNSGQYYCTASNSDRQDNVKSSSITNIIIKYPPGIVRIIPDKETFYTKDHGTPYEDVVCQADCLPPCTYVWYRDSSRLSRNYEYNFTIGNSLFATKQLTDSIFRYFSCKASNSFGSSKSRWIKMELKDGPENVTITPSDTPKESSPLTLVCSANCFLNCTSYRWTGGNRPLNENKAVLTFPDLSRAHDGEYMCSVEDYFGTSSNSYKLVVQYQDVILQAHSLTMSLKIKNMLPTDVRCRTKCNYDGCPTYINVIKDSKFYRSISSSQSIFEKRETVLGDSGIYSCSLEHKKSLKSFTLDILHGPRRTRITESNQEIRSKTVPESKTEFVSLRCLSECNPPCRIFWYKNGTLLPGERKEVLNIPRNRKNSGYYRCNANGEEGNQTSNTVEVTVEYPPEDARITPESDIFYSRRNGTPYVDVVCEADCLPPCSYTWYYASSRSSPSWDTYQFTTGNTLFAKRNFTHNRYPYFHCVARNSLGLIKSKWIRVNIKDGPENVTITPSQSYPKENHPFVLVCSANCIHGCLSYSWWKYMHLGKHNYMYEDTENLTFHNISRRENGNYMCYVGDYFGWRFNSTTTVKIQTSSGSGNIKEGQDYIRIDCNADCNPECSYKFYRDEQLTHVGDRGLLSKANRNMSGRYTCSAKNDIMNSYKNSTNFVDVNIKYGPEIAFSFWGNRNHITAHAPGTLNLSFRIDSFPPSNVSVFHETNNFMTASNVTGQHIFTKPITSCLDEGEYILEAVNEVGSDTDHVIVNVTCSPIYISFPNTLDNGFSIGDRVDLTVAFKGNPAAEVSWTFNPWNSNTSQGVPVHRVQNQSKYHTAVVIETLNTNDFGIYKLQLTNIHGSISKDFKIQGPPTAPTDLSVKCPDVAVVVWRPGFDGGSKQTFVLEYSSNQSSWQIHRPKLAAAFNEDYSYLRTFVDDISPNTLYFFRVKAHNAFGEAVSESDVNCTRQNPVEEVHSLSKHVGFVGVGAGMILFVVIIGVLVAGLNLKRKRRRKNTDNHLSQKSDNSQEKDDVLDIVDNILYISADEAKEVPEPSGDNVQNMASGNDTYAVVSKGDFPGNDASVYAEVNKTKKKQKPAVPEKSSKVKKRLPPNDNQDGLIYLELDLRDTASSSTGKFVIHGAEDRTEYVDIDFTRCVDPSLKRHTRDERTGDQEESDK